MLITNVVVGPIDVNCYLIADEETRDAAIIDPGGDEEDIFEMIANEKVNIKYILLTHGHFDHVGAVSAVKNKYKVPVLIHESDMEYIGKDPMVFAIDIEADDFVKDGDVLKLGNKEIKVIHTPGHTKGGVCYLVDDNLFCGDTVFHGSVGRTDFIGGNQEELLNSVKTKIAVLDDDIKVYPGHGNGSLIAVEKYMNPYFK